MARDLYLEQIGIYFAGTSDVELLIFAECAKQWHEIVRRI
jgi:hypothetical protein